MELMLLTPIFLLTFTTIDFKCFTRKAKEQKVLAVEDLLSAFCNAFWNMETEG